MRAGTGDCTIYIISSREALSLEPLDTVGWLAGESDEFKDWAARVARWQSYQPGQFVYLAGDKSDGIYGLAAGGLEVTFPLLAEEPVVLYQAQVGFWIGDNAELSETPRTISLMASTKCRMLHLPHAAIRTFLAEQPHHWRSFYRLSTINVNLAVGLLAEALSLSVRARLCRRLLQLTESSTETEVTQDDLAKMLGVARSTLRPWFNELAALGAIKLGYRKLGILDRAVLSKYKDEQ
jgi:CRP-like cAMP-binding protein